MSAADRRVVVEADGGSRGNPGPAAYGTIVRDEATGRVLAEESKAIGTATNNVAEYTGLIAGLRLLAGLQLPGPLAVEVRMDSRLVIEQMAGRWKLKHPVLRPLALQAQRLAPAGTTWTWVPRERNRAADALVNAALDAEAGPGRGAPGPGPAGGPAGGSAGGSAGSGPTSSAGSSGRDPEGGSVSGAPATGADASAGGAPATGADASAGGAPATDADQIRHLLDRGIPTSVLLLRHGRTTLTAERRFSGLGGIDPDLDDVGRAQAAAAAAALATRSRVPGRAVSAVVSSPLRRTLATAEPVAAALGVPVETDADLAEAAFGDWDGRSIPEVLARWPAELAAWIGSTAVAPPGGGESVDAVAARVRRALHRVLAAHPGEHVVVVTHVTPILELTRLALAAPVASMLRMEPPTSSLTTLAWFRDGTASLRGFGVPLGGPAAGAVW